MKDLIKKWYFWIIIIILAIVLYFTGVISIKSNVQKELTNTINFQKEVQNNIETRKTKWNNL